MKRLTFILAACGLLPGLASAGPVTIYGILDASVSRDEGRYAHGGVTTLVSGGQYGSRLGLRGTENLGGLTALFELESGVNVDDGALSQGPNLLFGRKALVGLQGGFGTLKLGRQDSPMYASTVAYDPFREGITGAYTRVMTAISTLRRNDNTIDYTTPAFGHVRGQVAYTLGEVAGNRDAGRGASGSLTYADGPLSIGVSAQNANSKPAPGAATPAPIVATQIRAVGASYALRRVTTYLLVSTTNNDARNRSERRDVRDVLVGATVPLGAGTVQMSYIDHRDRAVDGADAHQVALGYTYQLSKRSSLYGRYALIGNDRNARLGLAPLTDGGAASGTTERLFTLGLCHFF